MLTYADVCHIAGAYLYTLSEVEGLYPSIPWRRLLETLAAQVLSMLTYADVC